ncbi:hypothetical protein CROQUDRAFT_87727 [Cronartium quercuum f. sp. fusiforme G11]|uniref:Uncharacterized protein n=1 Tax=Cronartium quercuum f. sp. fusiforme G11 TaxID=708437 RepID=A0A9P6NNS8_9BASI|nr:hypothetical protein CROQUDRAFT_87727 [Cronartium quercuum f. sp. fusiforme G11]
MSKHFSELVIPSGDDSGDGGLLVLTGSLADDPWRLVTCDDVVSSETSDGESVAVRAHIPKATSMTHISSGMSRQGNRHGRKLARNRDIPVTPLSTTLFLSSAVSLGGPDPNDEGLCSVANVMTLYETLSVRRVTSRLVTLRCGHPSLQQTPLYTHGLGP